MKNSVTAMTQLARLAGVMFALAAMPAAAQLMPPPAPAGNPLTPAKANLGKVLFWDEQLSSTRSISCGTCHIPSAGGEDPRTLGNPASVHPGADGVFMSPDDVFGSPGVPLNDASGLYMWNTHFGLTEQVTSRRTVTSINAGYSSSLFWDGRAGDEFLDPVTMDVVLASGAALESQAAGPVVNDVEMGHLARMWTEVIDRLNESEPLALAPRVPPSLVQWIDGRSYDDLFDEAFGSVEINASRIAMAIASYERTQVANQTPFDDFLATGSGLTPEETAGRGVFVASSCDRCHRVEIMTDHLFHYTGVRPPAEDPGRFEVTGLADDLGRMRTPSLRSLELRAPYMHNGRFPTIESVVEFYNRGGDFDAPNKDNRVRPLMLSPTEKDNLVAFLSRPLTDARVGLEHPPFDRPKLYTETTRQPSVEGMGLPGSGAIVPRVIAIEPPILGNPSFTVAVQNALGGANAVLVIDDADPGLMTPASGAFAFESIVLDGVGDGAGFGSVSLEIPSDLALVGSQWFGRWYVEDTGGGEAAAVSRLFRFRIFPSFSQSLVFTDGFESGTADAWALNSP